MKEIWTILQLLGVSLPVERMRALESRFEDLEGGYTERDGWKRSKEQFGEILELAEMGHGDEGVKYCLVHFFLDALRHDSASANAKKTELHLSRKFVCQTSPGDARLELLLMVQEDFPKHMKVVEELATVLRDNEEEIANLVSGRVFRQSPLVRG